jgi:hypothetical protein
MEGVLVEQKLMRRKKIVARMVWDLCEKGGNCCRCRGRDWPLGSVGAGEEASFWVL